MKAIISAMPVGGGQVVGAEVALASFFFVFKNNLRREQL
jgi:hypothetical protein